DKADIDARINEVLEAVDMADKADKMPHELSGGEQQRIAIARAILNHPKMIVADEPTGSLDAETADNILELLRKISQSGTAVIMTTHNMPLLDKYPGIVYRCEEGNAARTVSCSRSSARILTRPIPTPPRWQTAPLPCSPGHLKAAVLKATAMC
ncbi:MAG: ATP-binding cassette domain-containing protein, partial [Oscillospiraceae bacterium]|nr:ATP-binding cassette domain-containing protein [Oscillospiraceae bacterium]